MIHQNAIKRGADEMLVALADGVRAAKVPLPTQWSDLGD